MKISREQKQLNRDRLLNAAVKVFAQKGFKNATMKEIAQQAKLSDPVVYKYFPTKESFLFGYFEIQFEQVKSNLMSDKVFTEMSFKDQIQTLLESQLDQFKKDREFVDMAYNMVFVSILGGSMTDVSQHREKYIDLIDHLLKAAIAVGEYPEPPMSRFVAASLWDFNIASVYYWLKDDTKDFVRTSEMIDKALSLLHEGLKTNILAKAADIAYFLVRQHLFSRLDQLENIEMPKTKFKKSEFLKESESSDNKKAKKTKK